jgi:hypothetical protein
MLGENVDNNKKIGSEKMVNEKSIVGFSFEIPKGMLTRFAGLLYLLVIIFGISSMVIYQGIVVPDDAAETANNIMDNELLFGASNMMWLISELCFLLLGLALYFAFRSVNKNLSTVMLILIVVGVAIECINALNRFAALQLLSGDGYLSAIPEDQLYAQVMFHLNLWDSGYNIAVILSFGPWLIPAGYLVYKSGYFPKILGILMVIAGFAHLIEAFRYFLLPDLEFISIPINIITIIAEFGFCALLLIKGVRVPEIDNS